MGRLIDAKKLMDYCLNQKSRTIDCNDIARFPTAYDVDKVVDKLEYEKERLFVRVTPEANAYIKGINKAIEIVRGGDKNDIQ